jgi:hypothetical protein
MKRNQPTASGFPAPLASAWNVSAGPLLMIGLLASAFLVAGYAINLELLWLALCLSLGILIGREITRIDGRLAYAFVLVGCAVVSSTVALRNLPIHSFGWSISDVDRISVEAPPGRRGLDVTEPEMISQFLRFGERGSYETIVKFGGRAYIVTLHSKNGSARRLMIGDTFLSSPGAADEVRSVFVPRAQSEFKEWIKRLVLRSQLAGSPGAPREAAEEFHNPPP